MERNGPTANRGNAQNSFQREIYRAFLGEFEAITTYTQGAIVLAEEYPAVARLLDEISRVEMSHFEQLGQLLVHLGATPTLNLRLHQEPLRLGTDSMRTIAQFLHRALADERAAADNYQRLASAAPGDGIHEMLAAIGEEEVGHAAAIEGMLKRFNMS